MVLILDGKGCTALVLGHICGRGNLQHQAEHNYPQSSRREWYYLYAIPHGMGSAILKVLDSLSVRIYRSSGRGLFHGQDGSHRWETVVWDTGITGPWPVRPLRARL